MLQGVWKEENPLAPLVGMYIDSSYIVLIQDILLPHSYTPFRLKEPFPGHSDYFL